MENRIGRKVNSISPFFSAVHPGNAMSGYDPKRTSMMPAV